MNNLDLLWKSIVALPRYPVGPCLTQEEASQFAQESLSPTDRKRLDQHLQSCLPCCEAVEKIFEAVAPIPAVIYWPQQVVKYQRSQAACKTETHSRFFQDWRGEEGTCILSEQSQGLVFTFDTTQGKYRGLLARFALKNEEKTLFAGWLVVHEDPYNHGHYVAETQLPQEIALQGQVSWEVKPVFTPAETPVLVQEWLTAISAVAEKADLHGWQEWVRQQRENLSPKTVKKLESKAKARESRFPPSPSFECNAHR